MVFLVTFCLAIIYIRLMGAGLTGAKR
jgi:hypothetical protein